MKRFDPLPRLKGMLDSITLSYEFGLDLLVERTIVWKGFWRSVLIFCVQLYLQFVCKYRKQDKYQISIFKVLIQTFINKQTFIFPLQSFKTHFPPIFPNSILHFVQISLFFSHFLQSFGCQIFLEVLSLVLDLYVIKGDMICTFIDHHIIIFTKMSNAHRKLTEEEANLLFETTFLMISQQNQAEKQKNLKNKSSSPSINNSNNSPSPKKNQPASPKLPTLELQPQSSIMDPENIPEKMIQKTCHKFSTDKEESCNEGNEVSPQSPFKLLEKDSNSEPLLDRVLVTPMKTGKISTEMQIESAQIQSQMKQQAPEMLYLEAYIKQIKRDLEIRSRGKICKSQEINNKTGQVMGYNFYCKNDSNCPFDCALQYTGQRNSKNQKLYKLIIRCQNHLKACIEEEQEITFMKLTKIIDDMEKPIIQLLSQDAQLKPKEILMNMAAKIGEENHKFIYKGLNSKSYHKAAKKYFDNLIYKIKNQMGAL